MFAEQKVLIEDTSVAILLSQEEDMRGTIRAKGKCPTCEGPWTHVPRLGFTCPAHATVPARFYIDLHFHGRRIRLFADKQGQALDSYQRARNILAHINFEIDNHIFDPTKYIKSEQERFYFSTLIDRFLDAKTPTLAPSYKKDYKRMVSLMRDFFGARDVREIRKVDVLNFEAQVRERGYSAKSVKNVVDLCKTFFRYLHRDLEIIDSVPAFPTIEVPEPAHRWLGPADQAKLYDLLPDRHRPIFAFLFLQGVRPGEARALRCKDVDLAAGAISIRATFSAHEYLERRKGRGAKAAVLPLHREVRDYVEERVKNNLPEAYVFSNPDTGRYYAETTLKRIWNRVRAAAGLPATFRLYDATRHSVGSQLANAGVSLWSISKILGHSSAKTTERYAHANVAVPAGRARATQSSGGCDQGRGDKSHLILPLLAVILVV